MSNHGINAFNRLLACLLFLAIAAAAMLVLGGMISFDLVNSQILHLPDASAQPAAQWLDDLKRGPYDAGIMREVALAGAAVLSLLMLVLELKTAAGRRALILSRSPDGITELDMAALEDLLRWMGEDTEGIEGMPAVHVRRKGKILLATGRALLNPYVSAPQIMPDFQERARQRLHHASGLPVQVRLQSQFQKPGARRRAK